ncbi:hypothetical protein [Glutamicibacter halophytocola]|nr:hypothetical protein [Glutamicibacter halophytocola]
MIAGSGNGRSTNVELGGAAFAVLMERQPTGQRHPGVQVVEIAWQWT